MPYLSIVIPCKNEEENLPKLLASLKSQTFTDYEIIVADADSTDRTREIAQAAGAHVVEGGLPGPGRNRGAAVAQGEVVLFLDADVLLPNPKFLQDNLDEMKRKKADVATTKVEPLSRRSIDRAFYRIYNTYAISTEKVRPHAGGFCFFIRRQVNETVGGFDESVVFAEDHDYAQRLAKAGYRFRVLRSQPILTSVRRLDKDGRLDIALKYVLADIRMMIKGPYKKMPIGGYEMGGDAYDKTKDK